MGRFGTISQEQYQRACKEDLAAFLLAKHPGEVKIEYGSVLLRSDPHVSVKRGFHGYRNFRTDETGNNIDFLIKFLGYGYQDAVLALIGESEGRSRQPVQELLPDIPLGPKEITLPEPAKAYRNVYAFLLGRKIPADVIKDLIDRRILYQSLQGNNAVFLSPQGDYAELRGTNTYADIRCRERDGCSRYEPGEHQWCRLMDVCLDYRKDPFHGSRKSQPDRFWYYQPDARFPDQIYVCEAAIDAVSLYVLHRQHGVNVPSVYVSIGGAANQKTIDRLRNGARAGQKVILAVDNDDAGQSCRDRNPDLDYILPVGKDWNDDLKENMYYGERTD